MSSTLVADRLPEVGRVLVQFGIARSTCARRRAEQLTLPSRRATVRRWVDALIPLVSDSSDPLGVLGLRTPRLPLAQAPGTCAMVQRTEEGCIKVVLDPEA